MRLFLKPHSSMATNGTFVKVLELENQCPNFAVQLLPSANSSKIQLIWCNFCKFLFTPYSCPSIQKLMSTLLLSIGLVRELLSFTSHLLVCDVMKPRMLNLLRCSRNIFQPTVLAIMFGFHNFTFYHFSLHWVILHNSG